MIRRRAILSTRSLFLSQSIIALLAMGPSSIAVADAEQETVKQLQTRVKVLQLELKKVAAELRNTGVESEIVSKQDSIELNVRYDGEKDFV